MAHSVKWLTSGEAATARYKRLTDGQTYPMITHQYVVHVELNGNWKTSSVFRKSMPIALTMLLLLPSSG
jgi:hypothetical protein